MSSIGFIGSYIYNRDYFHLQFGLVLLTVSLVLYILQLRELNLIRIHTIRKPNINVEILKKFHREKQDNVFGGGHRLYGYRSKGVKSEHFEYYFEKDIVYMAVFGSPEAHPGIELYSPLISFLRNRRLRKEVKELLQKET